MPFPCFLWQNYRYFPLSCFAFDRIINAPRSLFYRPAVMLRSALQPPLLLSPFRSSAPHLHMSNSQMLGKVESGLPAKIWRLVGCIVGTSKRKTVFFLRRTSLSWSVILVVQVSLLCQWYIMNLVIIFHRSSKSAFDVNKVQISL